MKQNIKPYSDDLYAIFNKAINLSKKYYHTWCGTPHLFISLISFLNSQKDDERYKNIFDNLTGILNGSEVTGEKFKKQFLINCPVGAEPVAGTKFEITVDDEFLKIKSNLDKKVLAEKRSMEVEDFILELFADKSFTLFMILSAIIGSDMKTEEMYDKIIKMFKKITAPKIEDFEDLPELTNLNEFVLKDPQTVIGADKYINSICMSLSGRAIKNAILTGPAGTGKTTYVYELAKRINDGNVPKHLQDKLIYQLDTASLIAGTRYRGDFEEKLVNIIKVVKEHQNVILFVDEAQTLVKLGDSEQGANNAGNILKPYITRGEIQMILATTDDEYTQYIATQKAFARRFHEIKINEPTKEETRQILEGMLPVETEYFNKTIQSELLDEIINLSDKYTLDQANPAKAINMLELACSYSKVFEEEKQEVNVNDIMESVKLKYDIYISNNKLADTKKELFTVLLGQDRALNEVLRALTVVDMGLTDPTKPMFSVLLAGASGSGKTETAKIIAKNYFGSEKNLVRIDCNGYSDEMSVSKLLGSSAGYVGYEDQSELVRGIKQHPSCVVLFDEFDKANPKVQEVLLNILDEGYLVDNRGNKVSFRNTIIIFTSNFGCNKDTGKLVGMGLVKTKSNEGNREIKKAIEEKLSKAFLSRLNGVIYYDSLPKEIINKLIDRYVKKYNELSNKNIQLSETDREEIYKNADIETEGARNIEQSVRIKMAEVALNNLEVKNERTDENKESVLSD